MNALQRYRPCISYQLKWFWLSNYRIRLAFDCCVNCLPFIRKMQMFHFSITRGTQHRDKGNVVKIKPMNNVMNNAWTKNYKNRNDFTADKFVTSPKNRWMSPPAMTAVPTNPSSSTAAASATSAVQTSSANSPSSSSSTSQRTSNNASNGDSLFEPSVEMMVNDFDDERTLEEEEALADAEDPSTELSNLQRVSN